MSERIEATTEHQLTLIHAAAGTWYAGCSGCPSWIGGPARTPAEAVQQHKDAHLATMTGFEKLIAFVVGPVVLLVALPLWILWTGGVL